MKWKNEYTILSLNRLCTAIVVQFVVRLFCVSKKQSVRYTREVIFVELRVDMDNDKELKGKEFKQDDSETQKKCEDKADEGNYDDHRDELRNDSRNLHRWVYF